MQASTARPLTEGDHPLTVRRRWLEQGRNILRAGLVLVGGAVVVAYVYPDATRWSAATNVFWIVAVVLVLLLIALLGSSSRRRARRRNAAQPSEADKDAALDEPQGASPRVLALQVRGLEMVLSEQEERLEEVRCAAGRRLDDALHRDRERVRLTLDAMRGVVAHQPGDVVLNRLEAALGRLVEEAGFVRPPLCASPSGGLPVALSAPRDPATVGDIADPAATPPMPGPVPATAPQPEVPFEAPRVMPVPAPPAAPVPTPSRGRLRRRRTAGV